MGFKSLIAKQVQGAMKILGTDPDGLARTQTYIATDEGAGTYDPVTRRMTTVETRYANVPMTLVRFKLDDMDDQVRPTTDRRALIAALDLSTVPTPQDRVELHTGEVYNVVRLLSDPSDGLYIVHLRYAEMI